MRAFGEAGAFAFSLKWRLPTARGSRSLGHRRRTDLRARLGFHDQRRLPGGSIHEADGDASVWLSKNLRRNVAGDELVSRRQNNFIAPDSQRPIEDNSVAFAVVTLRVFIGLIDDDATF